MNRQRSMLQGIGLLFLIVAIAAGVLMFVQGGNTKKELDQFTEVEQTTEKVQTTETVQTTEKAQTTETEKTTEAAKPAEYVPASFETSERSRLIIVGASRVVLMDRAVSNDADTIYIAKSGKGFYWLLKQALPQLDAWLTLFPESTVVFQMGNNDQHKWFQDNRELYFRLYREITGRYPEADIRLMDILPDRNVAYNRYAVSFNRDMHRRFPEQSIGGHSYFYRMNLAFLRDGSHYTPQSSRYLYDYIVKQVQEIG